LTPHADLAAPVAEPAAHGHPNQFALLAQRRFAPFFWTQFLGAGNDNLFKFAFTVMITYQLQVIWLPPSLAGLAIGALFILPFLLFSATSGQLADKFDKARLIRFVKWLELAIMALAAWGFIRADVVVLLACVFLMGLHSTLFGPVKFAYLPQHLSERELTGGNGMVEMGTFVAILLGSLAGGLLVSVPGVGPKYVAIACIAVAILGRLTAQAVPASPSTDPNLVINWNPVSETWRNLKLAHGNLVVFRSLLGISWMWFFGAAFLAQFPAFAKEVLHGDEQVASLLLVVFSVGIGTGSLLCEVLSRRHVEIGLVPLGAIGMSAFSIDLYFAARGLPPIQTRIGIHGGAAVVGNMGSAERFDYTAIGDTVNLASRLEGANKAFGTRCLVSETTWAAAGQEVLGREVGRIGVLGREAPIRVFEPLALRARATAAELEFGARWQAAVSALSKGERDACRAALAACAELRPDDALTRMYLERLDEPAFDGEFRLDSK